MLNYADVEKMVKEMTDIKHFADVAQSKCAVKELKDKVCIKTEYLGLGTTLFVKKEMKESMDDNIDPNLLFNLIRYAKNGEINLDSSIGEISICIRDELNIFINNRYFDATMSFKNKKSKDLFIGLQDFAKNKISIDQFQELVNAYYYSIQ